MRVLARVAWVVVFFMLAVAPAHAQQDPKQKALAWLTQVGEVATAELKQAEVDLAEANAAVSQAQASIALAQQHGDTASEVKSRDALATAESAVARHKARVASARATRAKMQSLLANIVPGATGVATEVSGAVSVKVGGQSRQWNGSPVAFQPGDQIEVGPGGRAVVTLDDGTSITLGDNQLFSNSTSFFIFEAKPNASPNAPLLDRSVGYLKQGVMRMIERSAPRTGRGPGAVLGSRRFRMPYTLVAVRGTEFELRAMPNRPSGFVPFSGDVEITADTAAPPAIPLTKWWPPAPAPSGASLGRGARVALLTGKARIGDRNGASRAAAGGAVMADWEHLETEPNAMAVLDLAEGLRVALAGGSRFETGWNPKNEAALYRLRTGRMHVWGPGRDTGIRMLTPNSVATPRAKEFEVSIGPDRTAEYLPISGALDITAVDRGLDWVKIQATRGN